MLALSTFLQEYNSAIWCRLCFFNIHRWCFCTTLKNHKGNFTSSVFVNCLPEFCETLSSSINVLIFGIFGQKFRQTFSETFLPCIGGNKKYQAVPVREGLTRKMTLETTCWYHYNKSNWLNSDFTTVDYAYCEKKNKFQWWSHIILIILKSLT